MNAVDQPTKSRGTLLRILGVGFGLAVTIGGTIGMGILRTPGEVAAQLPAPAAYLGVWIAGGIYAFLGALSVAELGTMIPRSGGWYVFVHRALGRYPAFVVGWSDWLSTCGTLAVIAMVVGEYASLLDPGLTGHQRGIALAVTLSFAVLQWRGVRWGSVTQNVTSALKTLVFVALAVAAFTWTGRTGTEPPPPVVRGGASLAAWITALQGVVYTYDGWYGVIYFGEEVRQPGRDVPASMFGGVALVTAIYLVVNVAYVHVLAMSRLAGDPLAAGTMAHALFGPHSDTAIRVLAILSLLSTINAYTLTAPRILYAMGCDALFSPRATRVNTGGTPTVALVASTVAAVAFVASGSLESVLAALAFFFVGNYSMGYVSVLVLRRREPHTPRPYRTWGYPWTTLAALAGSIAFLAGAVLTDQHGSLWALVLLVASAPLYLLVQASR
jgi:APA family basic amino acid/polyamine antiporter